jgi:hypothetical protein
MNLGRPLAAWLLALHSELDATHADQSASDLLRRQWLKAIHELGATAAAEDAAEVWTQRLGCSIDEGRAIVARAWRTLALP